MLGEEPDLLLVCPDEVRHEQIVCPVVARFLGLLQDGPLRFGELEAAARGLGPKTLSARLRALDSSAIIARRVDAGPPVRVEYSLTAKGRAFGRVAETIHRWGSELVADEAAPASSRQRRGKSKSSR